MRRFVVDSAYLGTDRHVLVEVDGFHLSHSIPRDAWHLDGSLKGSPTSKCLDTLLKLDGRVPPTVPEIFRNALASLLSNEDVLVPWRHVLPKKQFRIFFENVITDTRSAFPGLPFDYYETVWVAGSRVLSALRPASVDPGTFQSFVSGPGSSAPGLESFRPKRSGFAHPVVYDRFGTRTGRLTVSEGPNVLVLKREMRRMLRSSFPGGSVVSLDFRALEARVVLAEAGRPSPRGDLYSDVAESIFGGKVPRDSVKTAVLAELYGASRGALRARLGVSDDVLDSFIGGIRGHFAVSQLRDRLTEQATGGRITSRFGRPVPLPNADPALLVNSFAQSTGADVAILGFDSVLRRLGTDGIRPLFLLHDAIVLDVRSDRLKDVKECSEVEVPTYENSFPLKLEMMSMGEHSSSDVVS